MGGLPQGLSGVVVGALLNDPAQLAALGNAAHQPPHKAPPQAPVLEVKPPHMLAGPGAVLELPHGEPGLVVTAQLGIVLGQTACRLSEATALQAVAGYVIVGDVSLPLASHYRPGARLKARDGFCPIGATLVPASAVPQPDALEITVRVNGQVVQQASTAGRTRGVARLLADVTAFMTLQPGDVLGLGVSHGAPLVADGQSVVLAIQGLGELPLHVKRADA